MAARSINASMLVLAGGGSARMGESKAALEVGDQSLLGWILGRMAPAFRQVMVSLAGREVALPADVVGAQVVYDLHRGRGPLAGIEAGLAASRHDAMFVVACDMPAADLALARRLVRLSRGHDAAVPRLEGRPEPVCAVYRTSAAPALAIALRDGRLSASAALAALDVNYVDGLDKALFANLNTPGDYRTFLGAVR